MKSDETENINQLEEISAEVLHVLDALKPSDYVRDMDDSKERIFKRVQRKIDVDVLMISVKERNIKRLIRYWPVASVVLLIVGLSMFAFYRIGYHSGIKNVVYTQLKTVVPFGTISELTLSDGTMVVLNGGSTLSYPSAFTGDFRQVVLDGEGFFDVVKDEKRPFMVHSEKLSVKVLGTRFVMKAYMEDKQTTLTLESGKVSVLPVEKNTEAIVLESDQQLIYDNQTQELQHRMVDAKEYTYWKNAILLVTDQQLIINNETNEISRRKVNTEDYIAWKNGMLVFRNQTIGEIASVLERKFNRKIRILSDSIRNESYAGRFKDGESVEEILDILSEKRNWKYSIQNGMIEITPK